MMWLELWTQTAMAKALGAALLHSLWEGALLALLLSVSLRLLRSPGSRYLAACLALAAVFAAFLATLCTLWPLAAGPAAPAPVLLGPVAELGSGNAAAAHPWRISDLFPWLAPLWLAGVLAFHLRTLAGWIAVRRLTRSGVCCAPVEWRRRIDCLTTRLRVARPVRLFESSLAEAPVLIGHLRPVILLPVGLLAGLPAAQVEAILAHELAHIVRRDYLVNLLQTFIEGLLFYHPAVWWMTRVIRAERENCCDDVAVAISGDARGYAAALAALEVNRTTAREMALAATGANLMNRIRRILKTPELSRSDWAPLTSALALTLVLAAGLAAWESAPLPQAQAAPQAQPAPAVESPAPPAAPQAQADPMSTPYRKWLNEDVAYIITDQERAAYKALATDAEREAFIEQFWLKRDPTPGTPENEFKTEHYRRIAYANQHFSSGIPGWKTDRGRIYMTFGPPDEIDAHPAGGAYQRPASEGGGQISTVPFQQWRYRFIEGVGANVVIEFIDPTGKNEYRMTSDPNEKDALKHPPLSQPHNSFVSVGGDPQVTVSVAAEGNVSYQIEQNALAGMWTYKAVVMSNGATIAQGRDEKAIGASAVGARLSLTGSFHLDPAAYTLQIEVKDPAGATQTKSVDFYVN